MVHSTKILGIALAATLALAGCKSGGDAGHDTKGGDAAHGKSGDMAGKTGDASTAGKTGDTGAAASGPKSTLSATVMFTGTAPTPAKLKREADPFCAKTAMTSEEVLVKDGKLANVLVRVKDGASGSFTAPTTNAIVDQVDCMYRPRVQGVVAGQTIEVKNSDKTGHNVHTYKGDETIFNRAQPQPGTFTKKGDELGVKEGPIAFKCDIHPWMTGYVVVNTNPYFAVSDETGLAKIELPAGKYTLEAWHEKFGVKTAEVTVEEGKPAEVKFEYAGTEKSGS